MSSENLEAKIESAASHARPSTPQERDAMRAVAEQFDAAFRLGDADALMATLAPSASCEFKPSGLRLNARGTIAELFRRTMPGLAESFSGRRQLREWSNQNGLLREWTYPVRLPSGEVVPTTQLEIMEFGEGLRDTISYRIRMNLLFSRRFVEILGDDFMALPGIEQIPG
jgi:hypothetical protein